ncbi:MAG: hypothetical protein IH857_08565 [Deltaproteobacteria bacterium]|nr:hypothetical protein [Deltaproteobacteria bacterium]
MRVVSASSMADCQHENPIVQSTIEPCANGLPVHERLPSLFDDCSILRSASLEIETRGSEGLRYRLGSKREMEELSLREYLFSGGVCVIEWFEHLPTEEVEEYMHVAFAYTNGSKRRLTLTAYGRHYEGIIKGLRQNADCKVQNAKSKKRRGF